MTAPDISFEMMQIKHGFLDATNSWQRPCVLFRPKVHLDGNKWCALYGEDAQRGVCGFGDSPALAMDDFDRVWCKSVKDDDDQS